MNRLWIERDSLYKRTVSTKNGLCERKKNSSKPRDIGRQWLMYFWSTCSIKWGDEQKPVSRHTLLMRISSILKCFDAAIKAF